MLAPESYNRVGSWKTHSILSLQPKGPLQQDLQYRYTLGPPISCYLRQWQVIHAQTCIGECPTPT